MINATVFYHREDGVWWAESPDAEGWSAAADTYSQLHDLVHDGLKFHFETSDVLIEERLADGAPLRGNLWSAGIDVFTGAIARVTTGLGVADIAPGRSPYSGDRVPA